MAGNQPVQNGTPLPKKNDWQRVDPDRAAQELCVAEGTAAEAGMEVVKAGIRSGEYVMIARLVNRREEIFIGTEEEVAARMKETEQDAWKDLYREIAQAHAFKPAASKIGPDQKVLGQSQVPALTAEQSAFVERQRLTAMTAEEIASAPAMDQDAAYGEHIARVLGAVREQFGREGLQAVALFAASLGSDAALAGADDDPAYWTPMEFVALAAQKMAEPPGPDAACHSEGVQ